MSDKKNCFIPLEFISDIQTAVMGKNEQFAVYFLEMVIKTGITFILFFNFISAHLFKPLHVEIKF